MVSTPSMPSSPFWSLLSVTACLASTWGEDDRNPLKLRYCQTELFCSVSPFSHGLWTSRFRFLRTSPFLSPSPDCGGAGTLGGGGGGGRGPFCARFLLPSLSSSFSMTMLLLAFPSCRARIGSPCCSNSSWEGPPRAFQMLSTVADRLLHVCTAHPPPASLVLRPLGDRGASFPPGTPSLC
jgi:hypothetical protein